MSTLTRADEPTSSSHLVVERVQRPIRNGIVDEVVVAGTAHVSRDSAREAAALVRSLRPSALLVELDNSRVPSQLLAEHAHTFAAGLNAHSLQRSCLRNPSRMLHFSLPACALAVVLGSTEAVQAVAGASAIAGRDMVAVIEAALASSFGTRVILGDRPALVTLARCAAQTGLWSMLSLIPAALSAIGGSYDVYGYKPTARQSIAWLWTLLRRDWPGFAAVLDGIIRTCNSDPASLLARIRAVRPAAADAVDLQHALILEAAKNGVLPAGSRRKLCRALEAEGAATIGMPFHVYGEPPLSPDMAALMSVLPPAQEPPVKPSLASPTAGHGAGAKLAQLDAAKKRRPGATAASRGTAASRTDAPSVTAIDATSAAVPAHYPAALSSERDLLLGDAIARMPATWRASQAAAGVRPPDAGRVFMAVVGSHHVPGILRVLGASAAARPADLPCSTGLLSAAAAAAMHPSLGTARSSSIIGSPFTGHHQAVLERLNRVPIAPFVLQTLLPLAFLLLFASLPFLRIVPTWLRWSAALTLMLSAAALRLVVYRVKEYWARLRHAFTGAASARVVGDADAAQAATAMAHGSKPRAAAAAAAAALATGEGVKKRAAAAPK